jgi:predicted RNA polymerase sigma factor
VSGSPPRISRPTAFHLARADLLRRLGDRTGARACYERAAALADNAQVRGVVAIRFAFCRTHRS